MNDKSSPPRPWRRALFLLPALLSAALIQAVGAGQPLAWTGFTMALVVLCLFTIVFGRFFCG